MSNFNSDGYILIDMSEADFTKASQFINGFYDRIKSVINANKLAVVINANNYAPMAATIKVTGLLIDIITDIYIFTINSNNILIIKENSGSFTEVTIVPALLSGVKIADYTVGDQSGSLYAPEMQSEINDNISSLTTTYSSDKIDALLSDVTIENLSDIEDININSISNGDILSYDSNSDKWVNIPKPSGAEVDILTITNVSEKVNSFTGQIFKLGKILFISCTFACTESNNNRLLFQIANINVAESGTRVYLSNSPSHRIMISNADNNISILTNSVSFPATVALNGIVLLS